MVTRPLLSKANYPLPMKPKLLKSLYDFYTQQNSPIPRNRILEGLLKEGKMNGLDKGTSDSTFQERLYHEWDQDLWRNFYEVEF